MIFINSLIFEAVFPLLETDMKNRENSTPIFVNGRRQS